MREERRIELESSLDAAYASGDESRVNAIRRTIERETLECTSHTAERIKRIERAIDGLTNEVRDLGGAFDAFTARNDGRKDGAKFVVELFRVIVAAGGGAWLAKILGS